MKSYKKLIAALLSSVLLFNTSATVFSEGAEASADSVSDEPSEISETSGVDKVWDFSDGNWQVGDYTSEYGYDLGYIGAGTAISKINTLSHGDFTFTHALRLSSRSQMMYLGTGEDINIFPTDGYMRFKVGGDSEITLYAIWTGADKNPDGVAGVVCSLWIFDDVTASSPSFDASYSVNNSDVLSLSIPPFLPVYKGTVTYNGPPATLYMYSHPGKMDVLRVEATNVISGIEDFPGTSTEPTPTPATSAPSSEPTETPAPSNEPTETPTPRPSSGGGGGGGGGSVATSTPTPTPTETPTTVPTEPPTPSSSSIAVEETPIPTDKPVKRSALRLRMADVNISLAEGSKIDSPIYNVTVSSDYEGSTVFDKYAMVNIEISFTPTTEQDNTEKIVVYKTDENGGKKIVTTSRYDDKTRQIVFKSAVGSGTYEIAYVDKTFKDLADYPWAEHPTEILASKGIINGISDELFAPAASVKRGDFLLMLIKTLGIDGKPDSNFADVPAGSYYANAIGIAKELGITSGDDKGNFNPEAEISRQDMMVLVANTLKKLELLESNQDTDILSQFNDNSDIRPYARGSITALVEADIVSGKGDRIDPSGKTTRAESAVLIYKLFNIM